MASHGAERKSVVLHKDSFWFSGLYVQFVSIRISCWIPVPHPFRKCWKNLFWREPSLRLYSFFLAIFIWKDNLSRIPSLSSVSDLVKMWQLQSICSSKQFHLNFEERNATFMRVPCGQTITKNFCSVFINVLQNVMYGISHSTIRYWSEMHVGVSVRKDPGLHYNAKLRHTVMDVFVLTHLIETRDLFQRGQCSQWK